VRGPTIVLDRSRRNSPAKSRWIIVNNNEFAVSLNFENNGDAPPTTANNNKHLLARGSQFQIAPGDSNENPERVPVRAHLPSFNFLNQLNRGASSSPRHPVEAGRLRIGR
jgi:hypothetical protein